MPALDALHLKAELAADTRDQAWVQYLEHFVERGGGSVGPGDQWVITAGGDTEGEKSLPKINPADAFRLQVDDQLYEELDLDAYEWMGNQHRKVTGVQINDRFKKTLEMSETFYISPDMHILVSAAAASLPPETTIEAHDLPSPQGFMYIPNPGIVMIDARGKKCATNVILWDTYGGKVHLDYLIDKLNPIDIHNTQMRKTLGTQAFNDLWRLTPWSFGMLGIGHPLPAYIGMSEMPPELADRLIIEHDPATRRTTWTVPDDVNLEDLGLTPKDLEPKLAPEPTARWFVAALKLMQQTLVTLTDMPVDRATRKRLQRINISPKATVIEFRKREGRRTGESTFEYSHRFLRRGHWRNQAYKEIRGGEWEHRWVYIHPQIVGDPDKPLVLREHVNALVR